MYFNSGGFALWHGHYIWMPLEAKTVFLALPWSPIGILPLPTSKPRLRQLSQTTSSLSFILCDFKDAHFTALAMPFVSLEMHHNSPTSVWPIKNFPWLYRHFPLAGGGNSYPHQLRLRAPRTGMLSYLLLYLAEKTCTTLTIVFSNDIIGIYQYWYA
jgi:hypothetical protein